MIAKYRLQLPQLKDSIILTEGGLNTTLIYHRNIKITDSASFVLVYTEEGRAELRRYYLDYISVAREYGRGIILDTPTWRANKDWGRKLGYSLSDLRAACDVSVALLEELRAANETKSAPIVISGTIGPRGDGYMAGGYDGENITTYAARDYHNYQIESFAKSGADMVSAWTLSSINEAIGITRAAVENSIPVSLSFTVETNGRLPSGASLEEAITNVDAATDHAPAYYMVNCAHPTHFVRELDVDKAWVKRLRGFRANASSKAHSELDNLNGLDAGNPLELAADYRTIRDRTPSIWILGGCCGTDCTHLRAICDACL